MWGEHSRVLSFIQSYCRVWWSPPLLKYVELVTFSLVKRWLNDASFVQRNECCNWSGFMQGNESHRGGIWRLLSKSLNASDLDTNAWPPECVVHDIEPLQLLEPNCSRPMISVAGICKRDVEIYSSQMLHFIFHWLLKLFLANKSVSVYISSLVCSRCLFFVYILWSPTIVVNSVCYS